MSLFGRALRAGRRVVRRLIHGRAQDEADAMASRVGVTVENRPGSAHDAFTHAYVSARLTLAVGRRLAARLGELNERFGSLAVGELLDASMDRHNNAIGREIAGRLAADRRPTRDEIAEAVRSALDDGRLLVVGCDEQGRKALVRSGSLEPL